MKMIMSPLYYFCEIFVLGGPHLSINFRLALFFPFKCLTFETPNQRILNWLSIGTIWVFLGLSFVPQDPYGRVFVENFSLDLENCYPLGSLSSWLQ